MFSSGMVIIHVDKYYSCHMQDAFFILFLMDSNSTPLNAPEYYAGAGNDLAILNFCQHMSKQLFI